MKVFPSKAHMTTWKMRKTIYIHFDFEKALDPPFFDTRPEYLIVESSVRSLFLGTRDLCLFHSEQSI